MANSARLIAIVVLVLAPGSIHAQGVEPSLSQFSPDEQSSIRSACYGAGLLGPASYYRCLKAKSDELAQSPGPPNLSAHSGDEQASIRSACYGAGLLGPASYYRCLRTKSDELARSPGAPDLSRYSRDERSSIQSACYGAGLLGPASYHRCLQAKAEELARWYPPPPPKPAARPTPAPVVVAPAPVQPPVVDTVTAPSTVEEIDAALAAESEPVAFPAEEPASRASVGAEVEISEGPETPKPPTQTTPRPRSETPRVEPSKPTPDPRRVAPPAATTPTTATRDDSPPVIVIFWGIVAMWFAWKWFLRTWRAETAAAAPATEPTHPGNRPPHANYRPGRQPATARIRFGSVDVAAPRDGAVASSDIRDALTGRVLDPTRELFQCTACHAYYHATSVDFLNRENRGACVACGRSAVVVSA